MVVVVLIMVVVMVVVLLMEVLSKRRTTTATFDTTLCFQTSTNSHWQSCLKMSHHEDRVIITQQFKKKEIWMRNLISEKQKNTKVLN